MRISSRSHGCAGNKSVFRIWGGFLISPAAGCYGPTGRRRSEDDLIDFNACIGLPPHPFYYFHRVHILRTSYNATKSRQGRASRVARRAFNATERHTAPKTPCFVVSSCFLHPPSLCYCRLSTLICIRYGQWLLFYKVSCDL